MDYKSKLDALVADEKARLAKERSARDEFNQLQRGGFARLAGALRELAASLDTETASFTIYDSFAKVQVGKRPSSFTRYEISPSHTGSFQERQHAIGFRVTTLTTYPNSPDSEETFEHSYIFQSAEEVLDELMKSIATLIAGRPHQR